MAHCILRRNRRTGLILAMERAIILRRLSSHHGHNSSCLNVRGSGNGRLSRGLLWLLLCGANLGCHTGQRVLLAQYGIWLTSGTTVATCGNERCHSGACGKRRRRLVMHLRVSILLVE